MPRSSKNTKKSLGRCLIKQKNILTGNIVSRSQLHSLKNTNDSSGGVLESITEQNDLAEFMNRVELSEKNYEARTMDVKLLTANEAAGMLSEADTAEIAKLQQQHSQHLRIPRRPHWDEHTTKEELHEAEREAFANWRVAIHKLSSVENLTVTPYEKNPNVWQQLWRVVERSDVVVQIVDARNPLLFRCTDLECYVKEVDTSKVNLLLVNKSDYLSDEQREVWAQYFRDCGVYAVFFSALAASAELDALDDIAEERNSSDAESGAENDEEDENGTKNGEESHDEVTIVDDDNDSLNIDEYPHNTNEDDSTTDLATTNHLQKGNDKSSLTSINDANEENRNTSTNLELQSAKSIQKEENVNDLSDGSELSDNDDSCGSDYESASSVPESLPCKDTLRSVKETSSSDAESNNKITKPSSLGTNGNKSSLVTNSKLYNREELMELLSSVSPAPRLLQTFSTIGLVGYPNVGKSSTINSLMQDKKVTVSATPGKTKHFQTLHLSDELVLCDCPGLVFPGFVNTRQEMILWGILPIDRIRRDYHSSILHICHRMPPAALEAAYSIPLPAGESREPTPEELLSAYAVSRSFISARGRADVSRSARAILKDFMTGRLLHCVAPPSMEQPLYHTYTIQTKCKNRVKFTPRQELFMPETAEGVDAHLDAMLGITKEESRPKGKKQRKARTYKTKGLVEYQEGPDGEMQCIVTKPWLNRNRGPREGGKKNPNMNDPYGQVPW